MKYYATLENGLSSKLKPKELFVYAIMYISTDENNMTDITIKQISQWSNIPVKTIEQSILPNLRKSLVFNVKPFCANGLKRNSYTFPKPYENFRMIQKEFLLNRNLSPYQKGFMIALYMQAFNNTMLCGLTYAQIIFRLNFSNKTFYKYLNELIELGNIVIINPNIPNFEDLLDDLDIPEYDYINNSLYLKFSEK